MTGLKESAEIVDAIQWHEGMLLAPQHFQQLSLRHDQLLRYVMQTVAPFSWGIRTLKLDPVLLLDGKFCILALDAIMPDGLIVFFNAAEDSDELSLDLSNQLENIRNQNAIVHLSVFRHNSAFLSNTRYQSVEGKSVTDINTGENQLSLPRIKPRLRLTIGEEPASSQFAFFPIGQITYKNEALALTNFIPPTLFVNSRSPLGDMVTSIISRIREKAAFLAERLNSPAPAIHIDKPLLFETQNILQGLVSSLPQLEAVLFTNVSHPYSLYLSLCALAGSIATCNHTKVPPVFAAYNHNDLLCTFSPVCTFIHESLDAIHENYLVIFFHYQEYHFTLKPEASWYERYFIVGARIPAKSSATDLIKWVEASVIGSESYIGSMVERRILGVQRKHIEKDDDLDLIAPRGIILFRIEVDNEFIDPDEVLHIFNEQDNIHRPAELVFFVKVETSSS